MVESIFVHCERYVRITTIECAVGVGIEVYGVVIPYAARPSIGIADPLAVRLCEFIRVILVLMVKLLCVAFVVAASVLVVISRVLAFSSCMAFSVTSTVRRRGAGVGSAGGVATASSSSPQAARA